MVDNFRQNSRHQTSKIRDMTTKRINSAKELKVYQKAYALAMEIFEISKGQTSEVGGQRSEGRRSEVGRSEVRGLISKSTITIDIIKNSG